MPDDSRQSTTPVIVLGIRLSILVVDADSDSRETTAEYLELRGFHVVVARSGEEAIAVARTVRPGFVLMDLSLPGMGGCEAAWRLKADPLTRHVIVVAVTGQEFGRERERAGAAGCDACLLKPYEIAALADAFESGFKRVTAVGASHRLMGFPG
jgi:two-component system cell cycle response regulator DivK